MLNGGLWVGDHPGTQQKLQPGCIYCTINSSGIMTSQMPAVNYDAGGEKGRVVIRRTPGGRGDDDPIGHLRW